MASHLCIEVTRVFEQALWALRISIRRIGPMDRVYQVLLCSVAYGQTLVALLASRFDLNFVSVPRTILSRAGTIYGVFFASLIQKQMLALIHFLTDIVLFDKMQHKYLLPSQPCPLAHRTHINTNIQRQTGTCIACHGMMPSGAYREKRACIHSAGLTLQCISLNIIDPPALPHVSHHSLNIWLPFKFHVHTTSIIVQSCHSFSLYTLLYFND